jgi:hypothetical protein
MIDCGGLVQRKVFIFKLASSHAATFYTTLHVQFKQIQFFEDLQIKLHKPIDLYGT